MKITLLSACMLCGFALYGQQNYYDVTAGNGYGIRFWQSDNYKIHMGNTSEYLYGPVTDYSLKMNTNPTPGRGWTWGINGQTPVAGLSNSGDFQIAGTFMAGRVDISGGAYFSGHVGFGCLSPQAKVVVRNSTASQGLILTNCDVLGSQSHLAFTTADQPRIGLATESFFHAYNEGSWIFNSGNSNGGATLPVSWSMNGVSRIFIGVNGLVGIGTTQPNEALTVNGTIYGKEIKVDLSVPGPDYVFAPNYDLPSLSEVSDYITVNQRLPEMPSAKEMEANGIKLGEMNMLLLKKIEELTLYIIQLEEQNNKQDELIMELQKQNYLTK